MGAPTKRSPSPSTPITGGRPQFRRQGSSYGTGHVHHMAVMLAPNRVDYSVNKGGLRSWIVLIVFVLLCSAILNIFSEEGEGEERELAVLEDSSELEQEEEGTKGDDGTKVPIISEPEEEEEVEVEKEKKKEELEEEGEEEEKEKEEAAEAEEEAMLTRLKEKAAKRWMQAKSPAKIHRQRIRRRQEEVEEEEEEEEEKVAQLQQVQMEADEADEDDEADEEEGVEEGQHQQEEKEPKLLPPAEEIDEDEDEAAGKFVLKRDKGKRRVLSWRQLQTQRDEGQKPRKELLKQRRKLPKEEAVDMPPLRKAKDEEKNEEEEAGEEEEKPSASTDDTEVIALRKRPGYNRKAITSRGDYRFRQILDSGDYLLEQHEFAAASQKYEQVLAVDSESPRAIFGRARLYQLKWEFAEDRGGGQEHGQLLERAMADFEQVLDNEDTPEELFRISAEHFVESARFRGGHQHKILQVQRALVDRFPEDLAIQCQFGATWLGMDRPEEAAAIFRNVLESEPNHALAQAYLGYILKVYKGELERGVHLLRRAIRSAQSEVRADAKFYFHLGDGLTKLGRLQEAYAIYKDAVSHGLFPSVLQRSVHNLKGLTARSWWSIEQTECAKQLRQLERHWTAIREEAVHIWTKRQNLFVQENANLVDPDANGQWTLVLRGNSHGPELRPELCERWMPSTCELLKGFTGSICAREKIKLSVLQSGSNSWPHCGVTNYVLEAHLGLVAPSEARIRVGHEIRGWRQGKVIVLDTSFEREITFEGAPANALRIALVLELWHPQVPQTLRGKIGEDEDEENDGKAN